MPVLSDCHLHSSFSGDCETPMEEMILQGISLGLKAMCFTEHQDIDFPDSPEEPGSVFLVNTDSYLKELIRCRERYADRIRILFGVELGLQPHIIRENAIYAQSYDFDFIIGSSHICNKKDPYRPSFYEGREESAAYREYFESILENIQRFSDFDVYGHLDYVVRYGPNKDREYTYEKYRDILDAILVALIDKGKGIEINTGGLERGLKELHPCSGIVKRYKELGGEIITIGSDSHGTGNIAAHFDRVRDMLEACGFHYYAVFEKRQPTFHKIV